MPHANLRLTPHGHLVLEDAADAPELDDANSVAPGRRVRARQRARIAAARRRRSWGTTCRHCSCGGAASPHATSAHCACNRPAHGVPEIAPPTEAELASLVLTAPMMAGAEYLTPDVLRALWQEIAAALADVACRGEDRPAELPEEPEPRLEPGRPRALQPGREPPRRRCAVRLPRHLHHAALGPGARAARAARPGAARVRRRRQPREAAVAAAAGAARRRDLRLAAPDGRRRARSTIRCAGRRARPHACSPACPTWSAPASSCACRRRGAPTVRRARR